MMNAGLRKRKPLLECLQLLHGPASFLAVALKRAVPEFLRDTLEAMQISTVGRYAEVTKVPSQHG